MLVLITYDVNTETPAGRRRLRKVAKRCVDHGQRVQNSVFECLLDAAQYAVLKAELTALIDPALDSLRFYQLGNNYKSKVELSRLCDLKCVFYALFSEVRWFHQLSEGLHPFMQTLAKRMEKQMRRFSMG